MRLMPGFDGRGRAAEPSVGNLQAATHETVTRSGRSRQLAWGVVTMALSRGIAVLVPVVLIPVMLPHLGAELYGLWATTVALTAMAAFADLGLGNGLMTKLGRCHAEDLVDQAKRYIASAYTALAVVALITCASLWAMSDVIPWSRLFNANGTVTASDATAIALVCLVGFAVSLPFTLIVRVQYAYQRTVQSNLWQCGANLSPLPLVLTAVHTGMSPAAVVAAAAAGPLIITIANNVWYFTKQRPDLRPQLKYVERDAIRALFKLSTLFLALTIVMALANSSEPFVVAHALDLRAVTDYSVAARLLAVLGSIVSVLNLPLWPTSADALAQGHGLWVRRTTRRMIAVSLVAVVTLSAVLVPAGEVVLQRWVDGAVSADPMLLVGFALWFLVLGATSPWLTVQLAAGVVRPQLLGWSAYLLVSVPAKYVGAALFGVVAIPYIGAAAFLATVLPAALHGYRRVLSTCGDTRRRSLSDMAITTKFEHDQNRQATDV
ncbi:lipopolysaccharide biosynthesis protein [Micromonospora sp. C95]|uniref:lipopolysaccharide biosynthesis protein n=1 Tax=Micromonospora sp. C95 TaxID=2824882 RepID=UPI001B39222D|nr:oligosaccharide flippase family protein [Micromonospora sp. C95]MBQ1024159.1 oligosaccharide flippase family protein [Micromonospora sp. C95]